MTSATPWVCPRCGATNTTGPYVTRTPPGGERWTLICPCGHAHPVLELTAHGVKLRAKLHEMSPSDADWDDTLSEYRDQLTQLQSKGEGVDG